jgi:hypothetical protein
VPKDNTPTPREIANIFASAARLRHLHRGLVRRSESRRELCDQGSGRWPPSITSPLRLPGAPGNAAGGGHIEIVRPERAPIQTCPIASRRAAALHSAVVKGHIEIVKPRWNMARIQM